MELIWSKECLVSKVQASFILRTDKVFTINSLGQTIPAYDVETLSNKITRKAKEVQTDSTIRAGVHVSKHELIVLGFSKGEILFVNNYNLKDIQAPPLQLEGIVNSMTLNNDVILITSNNGIVFFMPANVCSQEGIKT